MYRLLKRQLKISALLKIKELPKCSPKCLSTDSNTFQSHVMDLEIPKMTINEFIWKDMERWPNRVAIECSLSGKNYTYSKLYYESRSFAASLRKKLKLRDGDVVAIILPNIPEYAVAILGCFQANLVISPVNPGYTIDEQYRQINTSNAKCIITMNQLFPSVRNAVKKLNKYVPIISVNASGGRAIDGSIDFNVLTEKNVDTSILKTIGQAPPDELAVLPYSSGTTGLPKGVELTHTNLVSNMTQVQHKDFTFIFDPDAHQFIIPAVLPIFHIYGLTINLLDKLSKGCKVVTLSKFTSDNFIYLLKKYKPDVLYVVPPIVMLISASKYLTPGDFECLKILISGAAPLGRKDIDRFLDKVKTDVQCFQGYGLTETSPCIATQSISNPDRDLASNGLLVPNTKCRILCTDHKKYRGANETGEIVVTGPQLMRGYKDDPKSNRESFTEDGWFKTGDLGHFDSKGQLFITGRLKELIKVKGFQVAPAELEELLRTHPNVQDAAVVGIPDPNSGEVPRAFIVVKEDTKVTEDEIKKMILKKLAHHKQLAGGVKFIDSIPKSPAGKILKKQLITEFCK